MLQFEAGLEHRPGDALAVPSDLGQDLATQNGRLVRDAVVRHVRACEKAAQVDGRRDFDEDIARVLEEGGEQAQPTGFVLGSEEHVDQARLRPARSFAEEHDLRYDQNRSVDGLLKRDEEFDRVPGGAAEPSQERRSLDQCQKTGLTLQEPVSGKPAGEGVGIAAPANEAVGAGQQNPGHLGQRQPEEQSASQGDPGKREPEAAIAGVGEQKREGAAEAAGVNNDAVGRKVPQNVRLGLFQAHTGEKELKGR